MGAMSDLIDGYIRSGLISDPMKCFRRCECCSQKFHPGDLIEVDELNSAGEHETFEICGDCQNKSETE